ncbi:splicing factor 3b subunit 4 [Ophiocordyceps sinensis CO18]|uniref:Splicing factor 3b subunit 4 n=1 Tax=Ophiocordyceps sinensis (strain Co18 / CGMCC 3.14243) TaxID=911162 RepID=T5AB74_OPHSC|nr:splicing factor 3b subunit 4 [Ophiocordyceps sinensis CO18]
MAQNRHWEQDKEATVYIGNIDERASTAMVYEIMLQMGPIHNIHMPRDRVTQNHQGFGFVEFRGPQDAEYAASVMNAIKLYGKPLRVNKASADKQKGTDVGAELFVGNLDHMVDEKLLYDTFTRFGPLLSLPKVARDEAGDSKGFGFVSFADFDSSDSAIANLNGQYVLSKDVSVQYAFKKDGRGERHGDEAERQLAAQAKMRNIVPEAQPIPQAFLAPPPAAQPPASTQGGAQIGFNNPADYHPGGFRPPNASPAQQAFPGGPPAPGFPVPPPGPSATPPGLPPGFPPPSGFQAPTNFPRR